MAAEHQAMCIEKVCLANLPGCLQHMNRFGERGSQVGTAQVDSKKMLDKA